MDNPLSNSFARMFVRMPLYVSQWLRTKYMPNADRLKPIRIPIAHKAGRIIYTSLVCNANMHKLSPVCYSAQMFSIPIEEVPEEMRSLYPDEDVRKEFVAIALPGPHFFLGRWIEDTDTWQLNSSDATAFNTILLEELWSDIDHYWHHHKQQFRIDHPDRVPVFYDALLDFCELYNIDVDAVESMHRALRRRQKKLRASATAPGAADSTHPTTPPTTTPTSSLTTPPTLSPTSSPVSCDASQEDTPPTSSTVSCDASQEDTPTT